MKSRTRWDEREDGSVFPVLTAGFKDTSPRFNILDSYNPDCSACWLGYQHTENLHQARLV